VDSAEKPILRKKLRRRQLLEFFGRLDATKVGMEACGATHHWARELKSLGHEPVLLPPQYVKPYVKRGKNDAADAEAICEAMSRPSMRFVPMKSVEQQAALMLAGTRDRLIRQRTQLSNSIRGYAAEFGLTVAKGLDKIEPLLARIATDAALPALAKDLFAEHCKEYGQLNVQIRKIETRLMAWHRDNELSRRLVEVPGIGPIGASLLAMKVTNPHAFSSGRDFAAWIGLTPKDHSTAGKTRLGVITRAGDEALRSVLVVGATALIQQVRQGRGHASPWLVELLKRKPPKLAAVALANRTARIAWKLMVQSHTSAREVVPRGAQRSALWGLRAAPLAHTAYHFTAERERDDERITSSAGDEHRLSLRPELAREGADGVVDRSQDVRHSVAPSGTRYRVTVWNSRRENHLGQDQVACFDPETGHMIASDPVRTHCASSCR
jgi:transposase